MSVGLPRCVTGGIPLDSVTLGSASVLQRAFNLVAMAQEDGLS